MSEKKILNWDDYFMNVAILSSYRSKDPNTRTGACIVDQDNKIVGVGYNGFPKGCSDEEFPWRRKGKFLNIKYPYVVHAELNAILNASVPLKNCTLYCTLFPCNECAKTIIQVGIRTIYYLEDKYHDEIVWVASRRMLDAAGVEYDRLDLAEIVRLHHVNH